jgi:hypothetical protein
MILILNFTFRNLAGDQVSLMKATAWDLLNIPIDEAIDLFDNLLRDINEESTGNSLFTRVEELDLTRLKLTVSRIKVD